MQNLSIQLNNLKNIPINNCKPDELIDITSIEINTATDINNRILQYIKDVKNPYLFKVGDTVVHVKFSQEKASLYEKFAELIANY